RITQIGSLKLRGHHIRRQVMDILNVVIVAALLMTVGLIGTGIWSMAHGGEFDRKHSTQLMFARVGMQGITFLLLLLAIFLAN
ncbi:MAG: HIG1 domain-containing protein, partial [Gammaproteobacteria bacterium]|nr:HIG1 domain-containing protein [Gammaproteobacteria bacterium]